jgi:TPR repeat protein
MKRGVFVFGVICVLASSAWAGFDEGMAAWGRGKFAAAFAEFKILAEQGHAQAQNNLGYMYDNGEGIARNDGAAEKWYRKAAEQGITESQNNLGLMYAVGRGGLKKDNVKALKWLSIATANGDSNAEFNRDSISTKMSPKDIAEARALAQEWLAAHSK